jgi:hypothetical protein
MKITIYEPVEVEVDDDMIHCGEKCRYLVKMNTECEIGGMSRFETTELEKEGDKFIRCRVCKELVLKVLEKLCDEGEIV